MKTLALQPINQERTSVMETTNYDIFSGWRYNRVLRSTKQLEEDLTEIGYMVIPVIVDDNFNIYDGHHRVRAAKECGIPVRYIVDNNINEAQIKVLNRGQKNWNTIDQIESFAKQGKGDYRAIKLFLADFKGTSAGLAMSVLEDKLMTTGDKAFKNGDFLLHKDASKQRKIYDTIYNSLGSHGIRVNAKFIYPLMQCMKHPEFDFEWFAKQFRAMQYIIPKSVNNTRAALDLVRDILNRQANPERKLSNTQIVRDMEDKLKV